MTTPTVVLAIVGLVLAWPQAARAQAAGPAPKLAITQPTAAGTHSTTAPATVLAGSASSTAGRAITSVVWDNLSTDAAGTVPIRPAADVQWTVPVVALKPGENEFLITATDSAGAVGTARLVVTRNGSGPVITHVTGSAATARVYEKYELSFDLETVADHPFFRFDPAPPPGVKPGTGVTVEGVILTPSGRTLRHPAFLYGHVTTSPARGGTHYEETGRTSWRLRLSPLEVGTYRVTLRARDASGSIEVDAGSFTATPPVRRGFIRVSRRDPRYFEFANGDLYFPIGPATGPDYGRYGAGGPNLDRPWIGALGAYSTNWSRWLRVDRDMGNEGVASPLTFAEHYPSHELSREVVHPVGHRIWMGPWGDDAFFPRLRAGRTYQVKLRIKTVGIRGPADGASPYGFAVKTHAFPGPTIDADLRELPSIIPMVSADRDWHTIVVTYRASARQEDTPYLSLGLENVTAGRAYIDQFSIREARRDGSLGGELVRHARGDVHTYVEQRPSAYLDWQVQQGEAYGVFLKLVVQDKNDWVPNHLTGGGTFADRGDGYFQPPGTKAAWLQEQWWRYVVARWGYSTAVHSWELCNEADPNDTSVWRHTQRFARFMHDVDAHPHLATTSFWCCWKPEFWGDAAAFPDVDYADLHEYTRDSPLGLDMAAWVISLARLTAERPVGKPVVLGETGIAQPGHPWFGYLERANPGIWYHNLLWSQLSGLSGLTAPGYWWSQHLSKIDLDRIARPFAQFVARLDVNQGGYVDAAAISTNDLVRAVGQKRVESGTAYLWVQHTRHTWRHVMGVESPLPITAQSGEVVMRMAPETAYRVTRWNTETGRLEATELRTSDARGDLHLQVTQLRGDFAVTIAPASGERR